MQHQSHAKSGSNPTHEATHRQAAKLVQPCHTGRDFDLCSPAGAGAAVPDCQEAAGLCITPILFSSCCTNACIVALPLTARPLNVTGIYVQELTGSKNIKLKPQIDESLIAGFIVKYGSSEIDLSVKGQLNKISNELVSA
jgi:ATP synthase delta (OSCP) subunit